VELFTVARTSEGKLQVVLSSGLETIGISADAANVMVDTSMRAIRRADDDMEL